eukprot:5884557-Prymnesium_polylepis.1
MIRRHSGATWPLGTYPLAPHCERPRRARAREWGPVDSRERSGGNWTLVSPRPAWRLRSDFGSVCFCGPALLTSYVFLCVWAGCVRKPEQRPAAARRRRRAPAGCFVKYRSYGRRTWCELRHSRLLALSWPRWSKTPEGGLGEGEALPY